LDAGEPACLHPSIERDAPNAVGFGRIFRAKRAGHDIGLRFGLHFEPSKFETVPKYSRHFALVQMCRFAELRGVVADFRPRLFPLNPQALQRTARFIAA
jgi:hypothetical protein